MDIPEETVGDLTRRLRRVEGQIRGVSATEGNSLDEVQKMFMKLA